MPQAKVFSGSVLFFGGFGDLLDNKISPAASAKAELALALPAVGTVWSPGVGMQRETLNPLKLQNAWASLACMPNSNQEHIAARVTGANGKSGHPPPHPLALPRKSLPQDLGPWMKKGFQG